MAFTRDLSIKLDKGWDSLKPYSVAFITGWNRRSHPFTWVKPADEILAKIDRKRKHISATRH